MTLPVLLILLTALTGPRPGGHRQWLEEDCNKYADDQKMTVAEVFMDSWHRRGICIFNDPGLGRWAMIWTRAAGSETWKLATKEFADHFYGDIPIEH